MEWCETLCSLARQVWAPLRARWRTHPARDLKLASHHGRERGSIRGIIRGFARMQPIESRPGHQVTDGYAPAVVSAP